MNFSQLPPELIQLVINAAVRVRGVKRASRLRYVCKSWAAAVLHAIFVSGVLDGEHLVRSRKRGFYRSQYLAYEVLGTRRSRALCIVRKVAERIVAHQCLGDQRKDVPFDKLRQCVIELCDMPHTAMDIECSDVRLDWLATGQIESIDEHDMQFQQALITAAVWFSENSLVEQLLPRFSEHLYLVAWDGWGGIHRFELVFGSTMSMAAWRGNHDAIQILMSALLPSDNFSLYTEDILLASAEGNRLSTVNLALKMNKNYPSPSVAMALERTSSAVVFDRLLPLAKQHLERERRKGPRYLSNIWAPMQLSKAAAAGDLPMVEYLLTTLDIAPSAFWFKTGSRSGDPVHSAARHGHTHVVLYLLEKGFILSHKSLNAAVVYGGIDIARTVTQVALEVGSQEYSFQRLLLQAAERENEAIVRYLLSTDALRLNGDDRLQVLREAEEQGLESMARLLETNMQGRL